MSETQSLSSMIKNLEICRLCLNITGNKINIFTDDFPKMLEILSGIKVTKEDNLPKISCLKCALEVKSAILTRRKIIKSYRALASQKDMDLIKTSEAELEKKTAMDCGENDKNYCDTGDSAEDDEKESIELMGENSPIKRLQNLQNIELTSEKKVEKIQKLKLDTNTQYLKKLRSFDLVKNPSLESTSTSILERLSIAEKKLPIELPIVRPKRLLSLRRKKVFEIPIPARKRTLLERQQKMRKEIKKMLENKKQVRQIDVKKLDDEIEEADEKKKPFAKVYYCGECKIKFPKYALYWNHMARHNHKKCHICNKIVQSVYFKKHMVIHTGDQAVCEICGFASKNSASLRMHYAYHHRGPKPMCEECGKTFLSKTKLMYHRKKYHMNQKDFKCEICGKAFHLKVYLDKHISARHMKIRPHVCEFCGKGFSGRDGLKTHRRQHTNEAPYECHICHERFRQKVSLRSHLKSKHHIEEEENYFCADCGKGYASAMALDIHARVHNEVKCPYCTDTFANDEYLTLHIESVHKPTPADHQEDFWAPHRST